MIVSTNYRSYWRMFKISNSPGLNFATSLVTMVPEDVILRPNFCHRVPNWRPSLKTYTSGNAVPLPFSFSIWTKSWPWLKSRRNISLFTVNLVHFFKRKSDFVLNRDHFHNSWLIHRFKRANYCLNIKTGWNRTAFPQVLQYLVHNVSEQFSAQNTIKCDVQSALNTNTVETLIRLSSEGSSVEKFDPSDSIDHWFSTNRKMGNYTHWLSDCSDNDDDNYLNNYKNTFE